MTPNGAMNGSELNGNSATQTATTAAIGVLAAASKTPFKTAFMITLGLGLGRVVVGLLAFGGVLTVISLFVKLGTLLGIQ